MFKCNFPDLFTFCGFLCLGATSTQRQDILYMQNFLDSQELLFRKKNEKTLSLANSV